MRAFSLAVSLLLFGTSAGASAQRVTEGGAAEARLESFDRRQRELLEPYLERGPALLARFYNADSDMPAVSIAAYIEAAPEAVARVVTRPADYARFMPALDSVEIESEHATQTAYSWTWTLALFTLRGRNVMTNYGGNATRGYRVGVRSTQGDLGQGRFLWRIYPAGEGRSLVVLSSRTDMRGANYVADQLASGGRSVQRTINISMAMVMLLGTKNEAQRVAGYVEPEREIGELEPLEMNARHLWPLLEDGDLVFMELSGNRIDRMATLGRSSRNEEHTRAVMIDPEEFGRALISGSTAHVVETHDDHVVFEWGIPLPIIGVSGRMRLTPTDGVISVDGMSGSLGTSQWRFDTTVISPHDTAIRGWSRYDMRETSAVIRRMIGDDDAFSHGLAAATQVMIVRSLRSRSMRHQ